MKDIRYLLSIKELLDGSKAEQLTEWACTKQDKERLKKIQGLSHTRKKAECIGAGLLLQLGLQEIQKEKTGCNEECSFGSKENSEEAKVQHLTISQVLAKLCTPVEPEYTYGEKGKPYFKNSNIYFNLSHSEDYVFCVFSKQEVGVDIQYRKPIANDRVVKRFFAEAEQEAWEQCSTMEEKETLFYRLWARKEAYGKLTGEGIVAATAVNVLEAVSENDKDFVGNKIPEVFWEDYEILDNYQISVCKQAGEKE